VRIFLAEYGSCLQRQLQHALAPAGGVAWLLLLLPALAAAACREVFQFTLAQDFPLLLWL
jgi:hypothetical protein